MAALTDSLRTTGNAVTAQLDKLDRVVTEHEATVTTAQLKSRTFDVRLSEAKATIAAALAL